MKRGFQIAFFLVLLLVVAGLAAPKFRANEYRGRIQSAMEKGLQRHVTLGEVRYNLLTGPGFTVSDVSIGEDPVLGAEPIAYVVKLEAIPRLWSLFTGHLEFSSLRLEDAQLNLSRNQLTQDEKKSGQYRWNVESLLRPSIVATFPSISIRGGRINFEVDHVKSVVYLLDSDLDITPPSSSRETWKIQFQGKPARTDRPARGSGSFAARGEWRASNGTLDMNLQLDRSEIGDLVALIHGADIGVHGTVSGKAHLAGPASALGINGRLNVAELHGWDQSVPQGEVWPLDLSGLWNLGGQQLKLDASVAGKVTAHYLVEKYLSTPRWGVNLTLRDFSIDPLVGIARHMGRNLPEGMKVTGTLQGALGYSGGASSNLEGQATLKNASLTMPGSKPVRVETAELLITHGLAQWMPTRAKFANGDEADFSGTYLVGAVAPEFVVSTIGLNVQALSGVPMLSDLKAGRWGGRLSYAQDNWSGAFTLNAVDWAFDGFAEPVRIDSAEGRLDGARVSLQRIRAHFGTINAQGEYRYEPGTVRPHRFRLGIATLDAAELERLAMPTLARRNALFGFGKSTLPDWLKGLRADGTVEIRELHAGATDLQNLRSRVLWDGARLTLPNLKAEWADGQIAARALMDLTGKAPAYEIYSKWADITWKDGKVDADTVIQTSGFGAALATRVHAMGTFIGRDVLDDYPTVSGRFDLAWSGKAPKFNVTELRLSNGSEVLAGRAALQDDGFLLVDVANGARQMKVSMK